MVYIYYNLTLIISEVKWQWHTAKYGDPHSEFMLCIYPSLCTHTAVGSHLCCGAPGSSWEVPCSRAPCRCIEGGENAVHLLPPPTIPAGLRLELATFRFRVWLSTIRPQFPPKVTHLNFLKFVLILPVQNTILGVWFSLFLIQSVESYVWRKRRKI